MASWSELRRYLHKNGWELFKRTDHDHYRKVLPNGDVLQTRVSRGRGEIPSLLWKRIMSQQLHITQEEFSRDK